MKKSVLVLCLILIYSSILFAQDVNIYVCKTPKVFNVSAEDFVLSSIDKAMDKAYGQKVSDLKNFFTLLKANKDLSELNVIIMRNQQEEEHIIKLKN